MLAKKQFVVVGTGGRVVMYLDGLVDQYAATNELVGLCDLSQVRMGWHLNRLKTKFDFLGCATFTADQFDAMIQQTRPDTVIVCTTDASHDEYIVRGLDHGCDIITEKPMTTDEVKAKQIFEAVDRTGGKVQVTFNVRFAPSTTRVYELLREGVVGNIKAVDLQWVLDTSHGADYFRRWHREKQHSGGLLIHKSTHHFDMINWWVQSRPKTVYAMGGVEFYGRANAEKRGERYDYDRYTGAENAKDDPFAMRLDEENDSGDTNGLSPLKGLYLDAEEETGYIRDRNVFGDGITSEDTVALTCRYENNVLFNYSLIAYSPWEGFRCSITGDQGRLEIYVQHGSHILAGQGEEELAAEQQRGASEKITVFPMFKAPYDVQVPEAKGGHGGADPLLIEQLLSPDPPPDVYGRNASHIDGAASILMGICANHSMATGQPIHAEDLLPLNKKQSATSSQAT